MDQRAVGRWRARRQRWLGSPLARRQATHGIYVEPVVLAVILALALVGLESFVH